MERLFICDVFERGPGWPCGRLDVSNFAAGFEATSRRVFLRVLVSGAAAIAAPQAFARSLVNVLLPTGEEPGRESTEAVVATGEPWRRQVVDFNTREAAGTIFIHSDERLLYLVTRNGKAMRYGIGVGRDGFRWSGELRVTRKAEWPDWTPPAEMIARQPYLPRFMAGGPGNPMGARALYLGSTIYRIHGTNQPETIGQSVSSGCFRLANGDVVDLFSRANVGAKVIVQRGRAGAQTASVL